MNNNDLLQYFLLRQQSREADRATLLKGLTAREQQLVKEAAVMGYVRGSMAPRQEGLPSSQGEHIPHDQQILSLVIDCCLGMSDLYPAFRRAFRRGMAKEHRERVSAAAK